METLAPLASLINLKCLALGQIYVSDYSPLAAPDQISRASSCAGEHHRPEFPTAADQTLDFELAPKWHHQCRSIGGIDKSQFLGRPLESHHQSILGLVRPTNLASMRRQPAQACARRSSLCRS